MNEAEKDKSPRRECMRLDEAIQLPCIDKRLPLQNKAVIEIKMRRDPTFKALVHSLEQQRQWHASEFGLLWRLEDSSLMIIDGRTRIAIFVLYLGLGNAKGCFRILKKETPKDIIDKIVLSRAKEKVARGWAAWDYSVMFGDLVRVIDPSKTYHCAKTAAANLQVLHDKYVEDAGQVPSGEMVGTLKAAYHMSTYHVLTRKVLSKHLIEHGPSSLNLYVLDNISNYKGLRDLDPRGFLDEDNEVGSNRFTAHYQSLVMDFYLKKVLHTSAKKRSEFLKLCPEYLKVRW